MRLATLSLLCGALTRPTTPSRSHTAERDVSIALRPLVGGPQQLTLHVVVAVGHAVYDLLPDDPTNHRTLQALLRGDEVDATVRVRPLKADRSDLRRLGTTSKSAEAIEAFALSHPPKLSLLSRNCWTFAADLVEFALDGLDGAECARVAREEGLEAARS